MNPTRDDVTPVAVAFVPGTETADHLRYVLDVRSGGAGVGGAVGAGVGVGGGVGAGTNFHRKRSTQVAPPLLVSSRSVMRSASSQKSAMSCPAPGCQAAINELDCMRPVLNALHVC